MSTETQSEDTRVSSQPRTWWLLLAAWLVALSATLGAVFIGEVMGQTPCLLCWYQRIFMFPLALILLIACIKNDAGIWRYGLPLALIGAGFALYHSLLYGGIIQEPIVQCGAGPSCSSAAMSLFGWLPLPFVSLIAFGAISTLLFLARRRPS